MPDPAPEPNPTPNPDPAPPATLDPTTPPPPTPDPADDGKGGKAAVLADLAAERDKRQTLEQTVQQMQQAQQAQMQAIAKAFGVPTEDDAPPDPEKLTAEISTAQAQAREAQVQLAVYRLAGQHDANADVLLDSASFLRTIAAVDPTDQAAVAAAISAAVESNPLFKATPAPPATPPFPGGPRTPTSTGAGSLGEAIAAKIAAQRPH